MASKVHFPAEQLVQHDSEIVIQQDGDAYDVHLGFLQINHQYEVRFSIKDDLNEDVVADPLQNVHVRVLEIMPSEDGLGHEILMDLAAYKEKLLKEELTLKDSTDDSKTLKLVLHARVLGKGKGTPSLRSGIHCTGINVDEDSEQSDWQGFD